MINVIATAALMLPSAYAAPPDVSIVVPRGQVRAVSAAQHCAVTQLFSDIDASRYGRRKPNALWRHGFSSLNRRIRIANHTGEAFRVSFWCQLP